MSIKHNKKLESKTQKSQRQIHATIFAFSCLTIGINKLISLHIWHCNAHNASSPLSYFNVTVYSLLQCGSFRRCSLVRLRREKCGCSNRSLLRRSLALYLSVYEFITEDVQVFPKVIDKV